MPVFGWTFGENSSFLEDDREAELLVPTEWPNDAPRAKEKKNITKARNARRLEDDADSFFSEVYF